MVSNVSGQFALYLKNKGIDISKLKDMSASEFEALTSLFVKYCDENTDSVDFSGVTLPEGVSEEESRTFFQVLREFFSLETIKLKADSDSNGFLDEEEVENFLKDNVNALDDNADDISLEDLEGALTKFGITLTTTSPSAVEDTDTTDDTPDVGDGDDDDDDVDVDTLDEPIDYPAQAAIDAAANYANTPLETLYGIRDGLKADVDKARADLQSIQDGTNPTVKALVEARDKAQEDLYAAMAQDSDVVKALGIELKENDDAVDANDKKIIEILAQLADKEMTLGNVQSKLAATKTSLATTETNLSSAQSELSALGSKPAIQTDENGNETAASKAARDAYDQKKSQLETKISNLESEKTRLEQEKTDLEAEETQLNTEIAALQTALAECNTLDDELAVKREDIMTRFNAAELSPATQAAKTAWEQAIENHDTGVTNLYKEYVTALQTAMMKLNAADYAIIQKENEKNSNAEKAADSDSDYLVVDDVESTTAYQVAKEARDLAKSKYDTAKAQYDAFVATIEDAPVNTATLGRFDRLQIALEAAQVDFSVADARFNAMTEAHIPV